MILLEKVFEVKENLKEDKINAIEVRLRYRRDVGYSYWDGHYQKRGYLLAISPTERTEHESEYGNYTTVSSIMGSGGYIMLREVNRKSQKVERELLEELTDDKLKEYINKYLPEYIV